MPLPLDSAFVKQAAREAGFHEVGIARAEPLDPAPLDRVLAAGAHADMDWLASQREARLDPGRVLRGVRAVIAVALSHSVPEGTGPAPGFGEVARYARGRDYHTVVKRRLAALVARLRERDPGAAVFPSCDVAPVMEKAWAQRAGIGWVGKNGCFITPRHGSWVVLGTVLIDRELEPDAPFVERCGSCALCLPACPTGAIPEPGFVDARRCVSFWTIERRGPIPPEVAGTLGSWVFGCDDCQTVCPWNRQAAATSEIDLVPRPGQRALALSELLRLAEEEYRRRFNGTALARARFDGLVRNACLIAGRSGDPSHVEALRALAESPLPGVREAARWALARLGAQARPGPSRRPARVKEDTMTLDDRLEAARSGCAVGPPQAPAFLRASGPDALDFLHRMSTQDLRRLRPGESAYGAFLSARGHLLGEGNVLVREEDLLLTLEPAACSGTRAHLEKLVIMDDVLFEDLSEPLRALPVFGPDAAARAAAAAGDAPRVPTGRRGAPCVELWLPAAEAERARAALVAGGAASLTAEELELLRVLGGIPRFGVDMDETRLPMEAGLTRDAISFTKGCYVGQETVMRATARGHLQRGLVQLALPPGAGAGAALSADGKEVGAVTSAVDGPSGRVGLGYVRRSWWPEGTRLATVGGEAVVMRPIVWEPEQG